MDLSVPHRLRSLGRVGSGGLIPQRLFIFFPRDLTAPAKTP
jgi:hypothetical protein